MPQLDLQQEAIFAHLVVCLLLQLLDQPLQQLRRLHVLLGVVEVDGVPVCAEQSGGVRAAPAPYGGSLAERGAPAGTARAGAAKPSIPHRDGDPADLPCLALDPL